MYPIAEKNISSIEIDTVYRNIKVCNHIIHLAETTEPLNIVKLQISKDSPWL